MVEVPNFYGIAFKTQDLGSFTIRITVESAPTGKFVVREGYKDDTVIKSDAGTYKELNWDYLIESLKLSTVFLNQKTYERLFPSA